MCKLGLFYISVVVGILPTLGFMLMLGIFNFGRITIMHMYLFFEYLNLHLTKYMDSCPDLNVGAARHERWNSGIASHVLKQLSLLIYAVFAAQELRYIDI